MVLSIEPFSQPPAPSFGGSIDLPPPLKTRQPRWHKTRVPTGHPRDTTPNTSACHSEPPTNSTCTTAQRPRPEACDTVQWGRLATSPDHAPTHQIKGPPGSAFNGGVSPALRRAQCTMLLCPAAPPHKGLQGQEAPGDRNARYPGRNSPGVPRIPHHRDVADSDTGTDAGARDKAPQRRYTFGARVSRSDAPNTLRPGDFSAVAQRRGCAQRRRRVAAHIIGGSIVMCSAFPTRCSPEHATGHRKAQRLVAVWAAMPQDIRSGSVDRCTPRAFMLHVQTLTVSTSSASPRSRILIEAFGQRTSKPKPPPQGRWLLAKKADVSGRPNPPLDPAPPCGRVDGPLSSRLPPPPLINTLPQVERGSGGDSIEGQEWLVVRRSSEPPLIISRG